MARKALTRSEGYKLDLKLDFYGEMILISVRKEKQMCCMIETIALDLLLVF